MNWIKDFFDLLCSFESKGLKTAERLLSIINENPRCTVRIIIEWGSRRGFQELGNESISLLWIIIIAFYLESLNNWVTEIRNLINKVNW